MNLRFLSYLNFAVVLWFLFLNLSAHFSWDLKAYRFIHEIIAVPIILGMPFLLAMGIVAYLRHPNRPIFSLISIILLGAALLFTIISFFS